MTKTIPTPPNPYNKRHRQAPEMIIQAACVKAAWNDFPETRNLLFHVANEMDDGGSGYLGARRRAEGIVRGVSDLILLIPRGGYHGLCIELKTDTGYQSKYQKAWEAAVKAQGYMYVVVRSEEEFRAVLADYLSKK